MLYLQRGSFTTQRRVRYAIAVLPALAVWPTGLGSPPAFAQQASVRQPAASDAKCELITREEVQRFAAGGNLIDVLRSRFPGLQTTDDLGSQSLSSRGLRGRNSLIGPSEPLVFVDGLRLPHPGGLRQLELIEPLQVERIEILPGPTTSAYYGTGASNGAVLIYTQTGVSNPSRSDVRGGCLP
jgi:outer membrane cobalamin receptor